MAFGNPLLAIPYKIFGKTTSKNREKYGALSLKLTQAKMPISVEMYMAAVMFYSIVAGVVGIIVGGLAAYVVIYVIGLPEQLTKIEFPPAFEWMIDYRELFAGLFISGFCFLLIT